MADYQELMERIEAATDPAEPMETIIASLLSEDHILLAIAMVRNAAAVMETGAGRRHEEMFREEFGDTVAKLEKNAIRMISDYARYSQRLEACKCFEICQAAGAENN